MKGPTGSSGRAAASRAGASLALRRAPQARVLRSARARRSRGAAGERARRVEAEAPRRRRPRVFWEMGPPGLPGVPYAHWKTRRCRAASNSGHDDQLPDICLIRKFGASRDRRGSSGYCSKRAPRSLYRPDCSRCSARARAPATTRTVALLATTPRNTPPRRPAAKFARFDPPPHADALVLPLADQIQTKMLYTVLALSTLFLAAAEEDGHAHGDGGEPAAAPSTRRTTRSRSTARTRPPSTRRSTASISSPRRRRSARRSTRTA